MLKGYSGDFVYINCEIYPPTSYMYRNRTILKKESISNIKEYVNNIIKLMKVGDSNIDLFNSTPSDDILELIIKEQGIVCISIKLYPIKKGEQNART